MHFRETNKYANRRSKLPIYIPIRNTCMEHFKNKTTNPTYNTSIKKCVKVGEKNATLELKNTPLPELHSKIFRPWSLVKLLHWLSKPKRVHQKMQFLLLFTK